MLVQVNLGYVIYSYFADRPLFYSLVKLAAGSLISLTFDVCDLEGRQI